MNNPEFKRNLWLSLSPQRLITLPALLALTLLASALANRDNVADNLYGVSIGLFIFIVWLWGSRNANDSIVDELRDKTWDQQRMSALSPWAITWGKLFGATAFNWYGGLMCLVVIATSGIKAAQPDIPVTLLTLIATGVMLHAALIAFNLHSSQFETRLVQRGGIGWLAIILVLFMLSLLVPFFEKESNAHLNWWGIAIAYKSFWLYSALLFCACAVFAAWRVVSNALSVPTLPWAWPAFACLLAVYLGGLTDNGGPLESLLYMGLSISSAMTYAALLTESNSLLKWRRLELLRNSGNRQAWLQSLPLWPTTLVITLICGVLLPLVARPLALPEWDPARQAPIFALMVLRDACLLLFFSFAANGKNAARTTLLALFLLDLLFPFLAGVADLDALRYLLLPFGADYSPASSQPLMPGPHLLPFGIDHTPWGGILVISVHVGIAIYLIYRRLQNNKAQ